MTTRLARWMLAVTAGLVLWGCSGHCPPGYVYHCQSGPKYGTQCQCIPAK
jgi:hypothetical protein